MKGTKRAIVTSVLSIVVCFTMLIGTTLAWFTDSASTSVNLVQSGTLDVDLVGADGVTLVGKTLSFQKAAGAPAGEAVLWEPGCRYELPAVYVINHGNLSIKYKITVNGITGGDAALLNAIEFTVKIGNADPVALADMQDVLAAGQSTAPIVITGHMKEDAGNEYQNLTISGIAITVVAAQNTSEYDSYNNTYDAAASVDMDSLFPARSTATVTRTDGVAADVTITKNDDDDPSVLVFSGDIPGAAIAANTTEVAIAIDETTATPNFSAEVTADRVVKTYGVTVSGLVANNTELIKIKQFVGTDLDGFVLYHNANAMNAVASEAEVVADQDYYYDIETGYVTFLSSTFSPFTIMHNNVVAKAMVEGVRTYFGLLNDAVAAADNDSTVTLLKDETHGVDVDNKTGITIDLNGFTVQVPRKTAIFVEATSSCAILNGTIIAGTGTDITGYGIVNQGTITELNANVTSNLFNIWNGYGSANAVIEEISGGHYVGDNKLASAFGLYNGTTGVVNLISGGTFEGSSASFRNYNRNGILSVTGGLFECPMVYEGGYTYTNNPVADAALFYNYAPKSITGGTWFGGDGIADIEDAVASGYSLEQSSECAAYSHKTRDGSTHYIVDDASAPVMYYYTVNSAA